MYSLIKSVLFNYIYAMKGYFTWRSILKSIPRKQRYNNKTIFVLLPYNDIEVIYYSLAYLDKAMLFHQLTSAVIIATADVNQIIVEQFVKNNFSIVTVDEHKYKKLLKFYDLYEFDNRFICTSLDDCEGRKSRILLNKNNIKIADLISIGIYKMKYETKPKCIKYDGNNKLANNFFEVLETKGLNRNI